MSINELKSKGFLISSLSIYNFSTLYTTLPHNLIKGEELDKLLLPFVCLKIVLYCINRFEINMFKESLPN